MRIIVIAPHPDDETFGCGGTLLRHVGNKDDIHWLIVTHMSVEAGYSKDQIQKREDEIKKVAKSYGFSSVHNLNLPATRLDNVPMAEVVEKISVVFKEIKPEIVYLPSAADVHSDHTNTADAVIACCKWFRHPSVKKVLAYETLSETDFGLKQYSHFIPNVFVDITEYLEKKSAILQIYASEIGEPPFPRSLANVKALASIRGAASGFKAAEAFMLLKETNG